MPYVSGISFERPDVRGTPVRFNVSRYDADYDDRLDPVILDAAVDDIVKFWQPRLEHRALIERDADVGWNWRDEILTPAFTHLRTGEPRGGTLLLLNSDRNPYQPEAVARIIYNWDTFHLPRRSARRSRMPAAPMATYIDTIAVAPWNRAAMPPPQRVRELGKLLLFAAILLSYQDGKNGRVAL